MPLLFKRSVSVAIEMRRERGDRDATFFGVDAMRLCWYGGGYNRRELYHRIVFDGV